MRKMEVMNVISLKLLKKKSARMKQEKLIMKRNQRKSMC